MVRRKSRARVAAETPATAAAGPAGAQENDTAQEEARPETASAPAEDARLARARSMAAGGDRAAAVELYREIVLTNGRSVAARLELGRIYNAREENLLALEQFEAARSAAPDNVEALEAVALAQATLGRFDAAEKELRRILRLAPEHAAAHGHLGMVSFRRGLYAQAEVELKRALELDPELAAAYFYRGEALNQVGRVDEALEMLERAVQLNPANARAFYVMGIVYDKKGRPQEAGAMYRKAREVNEA